MPFDPASPEAEPTLADLGEDELVRRITARIASRAAGVPGGVKLVVANGDDAAVLAIEGDTVISTDTLAEGFDFRRDWSSAFEVGVKAAAQNLADVAAMGARPVALVVSLAAPSTLSAAWALELTDGLADECLRAQVGVVGGDVSPAGGVVITGAAIGRLVGPPVTRGGALVGDQVVIGERLGYSGAGFSLLAAGLVGPRGTQGSLDEVIAAHRAPRPDYTGGVLLAELGAHALIDTSDGLVRDARRIAAASKVVLELDLDALLAQVTEPLRAAAAALVDAGVLAPSSNLAGPPRPGPVEREWIVDWLVSGGEDHALLACLPPQSPVPQGFTVIGRVGAVPAGGVAGVLIDGAPWVGPQGWVHFDAL